MFGRYSFRQAPHPAYPEIRSDLPYMSALSKRSTATAMRDSIKMMA